MSKLCQVVDPLARMDNMSLHGDVLYLSSCRILVHRGPKQYQRPRDVSCCPLVSQAIPEQPFGVLA